MSQMILEPIEINGMRLKNRLALAPLLNMPGDGDCPVEICGDAVPDDDGKFDAWDATNDPRRFGGWATRRGFQPGGLHTHFDCAARRDHRNRPSRRRDTSVERARS